METITSAVFLEPINKRIKELYDETNNTLINDKSVDDAELHFARGKLNGLHSAFTIIGDENNKFSDKFKSQTEAQPLDEVVVSEGV